MTFRKGLFCEYSIQRLIIIIDALCFLIAVVMMKQKGAYMWPEVQ